MTSITTLSEGPNALLPSGGTPLQAAKDKKYYENVEILDKIYT